MEEKFQILTVIEHEGNYIDSWLKSAQNFRRFNGKLDWLTRPAEMIRALDSFYPRKKFGLCLDTSSLYGYSLPIMETAQKVWGRVAHLHLAGSVPGQDLAAEINQPEIAELVKFFSRHKYSGFITAEVNGTVGKLEALIAQIYGASSIVGLPVLKSRGVANAQRHIRRSCQYLLSHAD
jgi:sugar phosphate isomerase/epimerase